MKTPNKPCPVCKSSNVKYSGHNSFGHGDCTHEAWIQCDDCNTRSAFVGGWGRYENKEQEDSAWILWNNIKRN